MWRLILHLSNTNGEYLRPHLGKILEILKNDLKDPKLYHIEKEPIKSQLIEFGNNLGKLLGVGV